LEAECGMAAVEAAAAAAAADKLLLWQLVEM
jgi:hypothetical protein